MVDVLMALALLASGGAMVLLWRIRHPPRATTAQAFAALRDPDFLGFPNRETAEKTLHHLNQREIKPPCLCGSKTSWMLNGVLDVPIGKQDAVRTLVLTCAKCANVRLVDAVAVQALDPTTREWMMP
jgi:hypothetical protein